MLNNISLSLRQLLGDDYLDAVVRVAHALTGRAVAELESVASEPVEFFPADFAGRSRALSERTGQILVPGLLDEMDGAPTASFASAQHPDGAPLGGLGVCRIGQDGRIHLAAKSEHYQLGLGHAFPGYALLDRARELGIPNATHNNTRGYITRFTERALVAAANGIRMDEAPELIADAPPHTLTRVVNLETGSLAAEAALKMMLDRFRSSGLGPAAHSDTIPVFLVMGDDEGGTTANYHGTTVLAQTLRGMWPQLAEEAAQGGLYDVVAVAPNDLDSFVRALAANSVGGRRVAGFCHEIVLMNYGGRLLEPEYLRAVYEHCHANGVPVFCDEIQSGAWCGELFLFRRYGLSPDLVAIGKGFPGGEYPASRVLLTAELDSLAQFGALVTNGQEELASLSYLVTMTFVQQNAAEIARIGAHYREQLERLAARHPDTLAGIAGDAHMGAVVFRSRDAAARFCLLLDRDHGIDISAQTHKESAPPVALTKLPVIADEAVVAVIVDRMEQVLTQLGSHEEVIG